VGLANDRPPADADSQFLETVPKPFSKRQMGSTRRHLSEFAVLELRLI
jgi:hypothetical protein